MNKVIKVTLIICVILFILLGGAIFYISKNAQKIITQKKPDIEQILSQKLNTPISLGEVDIKVFPKTKFQLQELTVGKTAESTGFSLDNISIAIDLMAMLQKELRVKELLVDSPVIKIIKTTEGINIDGLPKNKTKPEKKQTTPAAAKETSGKTKGKASSDKLKDLKFNLDNFKLANATIIFEDQTKKQTHKIEKLNVATKINLTSQLVSLKDSSISAVLPFLKDFALQAETLSFKVQEQVVDIPSYTITALGEEINGKVNYQLKKQAAVSDLNFKDFQLSSLLKIDLVNKILSKLNPGGSIDFTNQSTLQGKSVNAEGLVRLKDLSLGLNPKLKISGFSGELPYKANLENADFKSNKLKFLINQSPVILDFAVRKLKDQITLDNTRINIFDGEIILKNIFNLKSKNIAFSVNANNLKLQNVQKTFLGDKPMSIDGLLDSFALSIATNQKNLLPALQGQGQVKLSNGNLIGNNIGGKVFQAINNLPFISGKLLDVLPQDLQSEVDGENTPIKKLDIQYQIANQQLQAKSFELYSNIFKLFANGQIGFDKSVDLSSELVFSTAFTEALRVKVKEIDNLLNRQGELVVPVIIKGKVGKLLILPNIERLLKLGAQRTVENKIKDKVGEKLRDKFGGAGNLFGF